MTLFFMFVSLAFSAVPGMWATLTNVEISVCHTEKVKFDLGPER